MKQSGQLIRGRDRMSVGFHLYSERYTLLSAMLLGCELCANAVNLDGNFCVNLWPWVPDEFDAVESLWVDLDIKQATT